MVVKKSVVKSIQANGSYDSNFGTFYKFEIEMENGDCGEYSSKSNDMTSSLFKFHKGQDVPYEWHHDTKHSKIKPYNDKFLNSQKKHSAIESNEKINSTPKTPDNGLTNPPSTQTFTTIKEKVFGYSKPKEEQLAIIYQAAFKEAIGFHNIVAFDYSDKMKCLQQLMDTVDLIANHVIKKSGV